MKEILYTFCQRGLYESDAGQRVSFGAEPWLRLVIEPHEYALRVSGEVLRQSSCRGYTVEISNLGAACFYDREGTLLAQAEQTPKEYRAFQFVWQQEQLQICFGHEETVDHYPNCDGEFDRWSTSWVTERRVSLNTNNDQLEAN